MTAVRVPVRLLVLSLLVLSAARSALATSFVPMSDEALVDRAAAAAVVRVLAIDPGAGARAGGAWATEYRVAVEKGLKGDLPAGPLRVLVPGGDGPRGLALRVYGAPEMRVGERAILLLDPAGQGTGAFRPSQLFLGTFHEAEAMGRRFAVRDLSQASEVTVGDGAAGAAPARPDRLRDFDGFARWIADRAAGRKAAADYLVDDADGALRRSIDKFTLFADRNDHLHLRWFVFDTGGHVDWKASTKGERGLTGGGYAQLQAGLAAWTAEPQTPIDYRYTGTTTSTSTALTAPDGVNSMVFDDPGNLIPAFDCNAGGILAIGGPFYESATTAYRGEQYHRIAEADIVVADGLSCFFSQSSNGLKAAEEVFTHELGHTLGLGHSCGDSSSPACSASPAFDAALMRAFVHDDGRGGRLGSDDQAAVRSLYAAAPVTLTAPAGTAAEATSPTEVKVTWTDRSSGESEFRVEVKPLGGTFSDVGSVPANSTTALVQGLQPATGYVFRVRAAGPGGAFSPYSPEAAATTDALPGPCVADAETLCLNGGRFRVKVAWTTPAGTSGTGKVTTLAAADSGLFWFTTADNLELLVKVLDGCAVNDHYWVFTGPATNLQFVLTVVDTSTQKSRAYFNPQGVAAGTLTDIEAFATCP